MHLSVRRLLSFAVATVLRALRITVVSGIGILVFAWSESLDRTLLALTLALAMRLPVRLATAILLRAFGLGGSLLVLPLAVITLTALGWLRLVDVAVLGIALVGSVVVGFPA